MKSKIDTEFKLDITHITSSTDYDKVGFLFGAGASVEAGYPSTQTLTKHVIEKMTSSEIRSIEKILAEDCIVFDWEKGNPDIEQLSDSIIKKHTKNPTIKLRKIVDKIAVEITQKVASISPDLSNHISFLSKLKANTHGRHSTSWIFTTNYDPLFELAATKVGINVRNGFSGCLTRYWDEMSLRRIEGEITPNHCFETNRELTIVLVKLHGSIYWNRCGDQVFETYSPVNTSSQPAIILPRRQKLYETLNSPFNALMRYSSNIIGKSCKFIVSCGFSFRDEHILEHLIKPELSTSRIRLFAFLGEHPSHIDANLLRLKNFNILTPKQIILDGKSHDMPNDFWKFSEFVKLF